LKRRKGITAQWHNGKAGLKGKICIILLGRGGLHEIPR
jgi:hypothetical protein